MNVLWVLRAVFLVLGLTWGALTLPGVGFHFLSVLVVVVGTYLAYWVVAMTTVKAMTRRQASLREQGHEG